MQDRHVDFSITTLVTWALWLTVVACMGIMLALMSGDIMKGLVFGTLGCALSAGAATAQIRGYMCVFSERMKAAFELGREVERQHQAERELRSV